jgi:hypothetical protein
MKVAFGIEKHIPRLINQNFQKLFHSFFVCKVIYHYPFKKLFPRLSEKSPSGGSRLRILKNVFPKTGDVFINYYWGRHIFVGNVCLALIREDGYGKKNTFCRW